MEKQIINNFLRVAFGTVLIVGVLAVNGCIFGKTNGNGNGEPPPGLDSPAGVIEYIEDAYMTRDIEDYKECLSTNFTFYFDPNNVGDDVEGYIIPDSWGYEDEIDVIGNMFDEADSIDLKLTTSGIGDPSPSDTNFTAYNVQIRLLLMIDATNGYLAQGFVDFEFESYYTDKDEKLWRVINWWDHTAI